MGSYPGSWSQVACELVGSTGKVAAIDKQEMKLQNCFFIHKSIEEIHESDFEEISEFIPFDLVLSDMAPNISGIAAIDLPKHFGLVELAFEFCRQYLCEGGNFIVKLFQGEGFDEFVRESRKCFVNVKLVKPKASRRMSREVYMVGTGFKFEKE